MSIEEHEQRRRRLQLTKLAYAKRVGMKAADYYHRTRHLTPTTPRKTGRPPLKLPGGLSIQEHEKERQRLSVSKNAYAKIVGVHPNTYLNTVQRSTARGELQRAPSTAHPPNVTYMRMVVAMELSERARRALAHHLGLAVGELAMPEEFAAWATRLLAAALVDLEHELLLAERHYDVFGETLTLDELAELAGYPSTQVWQRVRRGAKAGTLLKPLPPDDNRARRRTSVPTAQRSSAGRRSSRKDT